VDTPDREKLIAATMSEDEIRDHLGVNSLRFVSLDGLYRACGEPGGREVSQPQFCDACFSGDYPVDPSDRVARGFRVKEPA
jgi:amidophosphoribosyltransferase